MADIFEVDLKIKTDENLGVKEQTHGSMTARMLEKVEGVLVREKPDLVIVYGDTNSTLSGALAAAKLNISVAHVEAGLRSYNLKMPEEINRVITDRLTTWLFCPNNIAMRNLYREGIGVTNDTSKNNMKQEVLNVGDVMYDAWLLFSGQSNSGSNIRNLTASFRNGFYLATIHRSENTDDRDRLVSIIKAIDEIACRVPVIFPIHPRTKKAMDALGLRTTHIRFIDPTGYFDIINILKACSGVLTDSGGLQKEAYFAKKPCMTLRDETEWMELVENGFNVLTGADKNLILSAEKDIREKHINWIENLYGDGHAGDKIVQALIRSG
jgi:UDP-GlcNAc3NAcA epimerase|tara:strand:- start:22363 stop:23337 length:975 start_codon:yes stop_codon:yes gene_type:complete